MNRFNLLFVFLLLAAQIIYSQPSTLQAGISASGGQLIVSARPSASFAGNYSGGVITIRWPSAYGCTLSTVTQTCGQWAIDATGTSGIFDYVIFAHVSIPVVPINWTLNTDYELFRVNVSGSAGTGYFELVPAIDLPQGAWYFEVGGNDYTNNSTNFYQSTVNNVPLPVELTGFTAEPKKNNVFLAWETKTEINSKAFEIERRSEKHDTWVKVAVTKAAGNSQTSLHYSYNDTRLNSGKYQYRLKLIDVNGSSSYSQLINSEVEAPDEFILNQNFPNPFNPSTIISYALPEASNVIIEIYNLIGERITRFVEFQQPGYYEKEVNLKSGSSGVYIYRLIAENPKGNFTSTKKMQLMK